MCIKTILRKYGVLKHFYQEKLLLHYWIYVTAKYDNTPTSQSSFDPTNQQSIPSIIKFLENVFNIQRKINL